MAQVQGDIPEFGLGDRFRKAREFRGYTIDEVAEMLTERGRKTSGSSLSAWERSQTQPRKQIELVGLMSSILNVPESWFWTGSGDTYGWSPDHISPGQMDLPFAELVAA